MTKKLLNTLELIVCTILFFFPSLIEWIEKPTFNMCKVVAHRDVRNILYITNPSEKFQRFVIKHYPYSAIQYLRKINWNVQIDLVQYESRLIKYIPNACLDAQILAVQKNPSNIRYIEFPCYLVQINAVRRDPWSLKYINNPDEEVFQYVTERFLQDRSLRDYGARSSRQNYKEYKEYLAKWDIHKNDNLRHAPFGVIAA